MIFQIFQTFHKFNFGKTRLHERPTKFRTIRVTIRRLPWNNYLEPYTCYVSHKGFNLNPNLNPSSSFFYPFSFCHLLKNHRRKNLRLRISFYPCLSSSFSFCHRLRTHHYYSLNCYLSFSSFSFCHLFPFSSCYHLLSPKMKMMTMKSHPFSS